MDPLVRLFIAIPVPDYVRNRLAGLAGEFPALRWVEESNIHLTLKFIGETESGRVDLIRESLRSIRVRPFLLHVSGVGVFPERGNPSVFWAGLGTAHPHLFQLHKKVNDCLYQIGVEPDHRMYQPHITLAHCKRISREALQPLLKTQAGLETAPFRVETCAIYSSEPGSRGPVYNCLESYPLCD